jgi:hypothetical protein
MEETQKSIGTTSRCFLKADISTLVRIGHFYFALTYLFGIIDNDLIKAYICAECGKRRGTIIAKLVNTGGVMLSRAAELGILPAKLSKHSF